MPITGDDFAQSALDKALSLQAGIIAFSTGGNFDGGDEAYQSIRREFAQRADTRDKLPDFVRRYRDLGQLWAFMKFERPTYRERRDLIWEAFRPLIDYLEANDKAPGVATIGEAIEAFDPEHVHALWQKALDRRLGDPEGAITAARALLETVCKYILGDCGIEYAHDADLPKLRGLAADQLNLSPSQHQEGVFKAILGNCQSVVNNLAAIRNRVGDAHGQGRRPVKPKPRHAELAVNLAGAMAAFLVESWMEREGGTTK